MSTVYLHIGMPKTGTTYIQKFMGGNRKVLNTYGYSFPDFGIRFQGIGANRNAHFMLCNFRKEDGKYDVEHNKQIFDDCFEIIGKNLETYDNVVLSDEALWNSAEKFYFGENIWTDLKKKSEEMNFELKIIVYLRRQDLFVQSYWAQQVKETYPRTFEKFLKGKIYKSLKLDYFARLNHIAESVGAENIMVRVYEKSQYQGTDNTLISDFLHTIGLELNDDFKKPEKAILNASLSGAYLETKRVMNSFDEFKAKMGWFSHLLQRTVDVKGEEKLLDFNLYFEDDDQLNEYLESFEENNSNVAKNYLGRENGRLFLEMPEGSIDTDAKKCTNKDIYRVLADTLVVQRDECEDLKAQLSETIKTMQSEINELKKENKSLQSTIDWMKAPFYVKVIRKIKRLLGINKKRKED